jgi:DNA-binding GntR family transcriptional regulator
MSQHSQEWGLELIERQSLRDGAYQQLKEAIVRGHLPPGRRLLEADVAEQLGVSRSRVREAFAKLEREGLLTVSSFRGTWVSGLDATDVEEIYTARILIEPWAARIVATRRDPDVLARLRTDVERMRTALEARDVFELTDADYDFHVHMVLGTGNRRLVEIARQLLDFVWRTTPAVYGRQGLPERLVDEHSRTLDTVASGNGDLAEEVVRAHLELGRRLTVEAVTDAAATRQAAEPTSRIRHG